LQRDQYTGVGVIALVGEQRLGLQLWQQDVSPIQIAGLAAGQMKANGVAQSVDRGVDLGAQTSLAAPDGLIAAPFLRAPALC
jgi:hypothetical protein